MNNYNLYLRNIVLTIFFVTLSAILIWFILFPPNTSNQLTNPFDNSSEFLKFLQRTIKNETMHLEVTIKEYEIPNVDKIHDFLPLLKTKRNPNYIIYTYQTMLLLKPTDDAWTILKNNKEYYMKSIEQWIPIEFNPGEINPVHHIRNALNLQITESYDLPSEVYYLQTIPSDTFSNLHITQEPIDYQSSQYKIHFIYKFSKIHSNLEEFSIVITDTANNFVEIIQYAWLPTQDKIIAEQFN
ncbi:hypothetical protein BHU72_08265 [Desulfuribacillus stibiiarsenatis]|uniref:Uncharacterized protein n=1 Tax=Desulfuribacillus stibiiarsenatis TaxID=1390249 RepID=A0A1E5L3Y1_9FIRM|nr:hypothetical protein [Desulfuribacillus stibiiarsenatis]OEH84817.1 hypothetical protein BHU72_08265 [Desulfuribacillus stibiiarsenatis]